MRRRSVRKRVSRRRVGLPKPRCVTRVRRGEIVGFAIHYSGALADAKADHDDCLEVWRRFHRMHTGPGGLGVPGGGCDVGYSHGICPHGYTLIGRGFRRRCGANSTTEANRRYLAVCLLGGDKAGRRDVTPQARASLIVYRKRLLTVHPGAKAVRFHSTFAATACPGDELRKLARQLWPKAAR